MLYSSTKLWFVPALHFLKDAKYLIVNTILGVIILILARFIGIYVPIDLITVLISALAGIPGAILVIILYVVGITL